MARAVGWTDLETEAEPRFRDQKSKNEMKDIYLIEFHRKRSDRLKKQLATQPKASLAEALEQYERIKRGSSRHQDRTPSARGHNGAST